MIKYLLSFVLGGVVGGASTYLVYKKRIRKEEQKRADDQIADMEMYYAKRVSQHDNDEEIKAPEEYMNFNEVEVEDKQEQTSPKETSLDRATFKPNSVDYTSFYNSADVSGEEATKEINSSKGPIVVDDRDFGMEPGSRTQDLAYYKDGTIVFDDTEDMDIDEFNKLDLDEVRSMLGDTIVDSHFDENDEQTLTVWNSQRNTYYRITKVFDVYRDT